MKKNKIEKRTALGDDAFPADIALILGEIEKEPVPEKLLSLARQLQEALHRRRQEKEEPAREAPLPRARTTV